MQLSASVNIPVQPRDSVTFGSVGTVVYRDSAKGVRWTAHQADAGGYWWIVQHGLTKRSDSDGPVLYRTPLFFDWETLNREWDNLRASFLAVGVSA